MEYLYKKILSTVTEAEGPGSNCIFMHIALLEKEKPTKNELRVAIKSNRNKIKEKLLKQKKVDVSSEGMSESWETGSIERA